MRKAIARHHKDVKPTAEFVGYVGSLHRAIHSIGLFLESALEGRLSQPEAMVLLHLWGNPDSTINDVHRAFLHRRSTLTSVLDRLESKQILERTISKDDRRNFVLKLTKSGRELAARVAESLVTLENSVNARKAECASAWRLLEKTALEAAELVGE
ncbi:MAG TPA: MarR family transcriptional regulator [Candidatus Binatia bacterium]|nr:MarR family transcriptional regulator [Candidatus Binatia bacterium]